MRAALLRQTGQIPSTADLYCDVPTGECREQHSLRADDGRVMYSNVFTRKCSERRTFMRGGTALDLYVQPGAQFRGHHWRTMLKTMYADKLPSKFDLYQAHGKVDMAALVNGNMTINKV
jgi:hypothetical protein